MTFSEVSILLFFILFLPVISFKCYGEKHAIDEDCKEFNTGNGLELPLTSHAFSHLQVKTDDFPMALNKLDNRRLLYAYRYLASDMSSWRRRRAYDLPDILDVTYGNHSEADKMSHYSSALATIQACLNVFSIVIRIVFITFIVFCVHRFVVVVIKKHNVRNVPNYRKEVLKLSSLNQERREARRKLLLNDFQTVWRYLQVDSGLSLKDPAYIQSFGKLFEFYLPERGQSIQEAFPLDFFKDPQMDDAAWLKAVLEGPTPSYRLMILSAEERKLLKDAEKKKAEDAAAAGGGATQ